MMCTPRGLDWYTGLFAGAAPGDLCGESSTHYTKLPTHPRSLERMRQALPRVKLIYVMRHPIDRLVSHYIHDWTENQVRGSIDQAVDRHPGLVDYGRYAMQLDPYLDAYGPENVLPLFFERLTRHPQETLEQVAGFLGLGPVQWDEGDGMSHRNAVRTPAAQRLAAYLGRRSARAHPTAPLGPQVLAGLDQGFRSDEGAAAAFSSGRGPASPHLRRRPGTARRLVGGGAFVFDLCRLR